MNLKELWKVNVYSMSSKKGIDTAIKELENGEYETYADFDEFLLKLQKEESAKRFDYTKWRHSFVDNINTFDELDAFVEQSKTKAQFQGNAKEIL